MSLINKKFLIVGGTGFIGYSIIKKLLRQKSKVFSLSTSKPKKLRKLSNVKYLKGNIKKFSEINKILKNKEFDYVINCGGYVEHVNKKEVYDSHYKGSINLYNIFKKKKLNQFIQIGSSTEYGNVKVPHDENYICKPSGIYGKMKLKATKFFLKQFRQNNFPVTIIRFYQVYGPYQDFNRFIPQLIKSSIQKKNFITSHGNHFRDFLFIEDAVDAIIKTIKSKKTYGEILNIGFGKGTKLKSIMNLIKKKNNFLAPMFGKIKTRTGEQLLIFPKIKKSKKLISWYPRTSISKGLEKTNKFYIKKLKNG
jgi:nucleoside-diphosphate-sugar epimerase